MIAWRRAAAVPSLALAVLILAASLPVASLSAAPAKKRASPPTRPGAHGSQTDFTGIWELDSKSSSLGSQKMENAVLQVTQSGDRLWIQPLGNTRARVLAEEVVVDGRAYEKALGKERGTLTAKWGNDAKSLWLEVVAGTDENPRAAVQRSVWRLSDDRQVWVRETMTVQKDGGHRTRLVFRRQDPKKITPAAPPG